MSKNLITLQNCRIENNRTVLVPELSWKMNEGEVWLVIGPNGGGKADFLNALADVNASGAVKITPNTDGLFSDIFSASTELVSLERAARLIQEERENDEIFPINDEAPPVPFLSQIYSNNNINNNIVNNNINNININE